MELTELPKPHVVDMDSKCQAGQQMDGREDNAKGETVLQDNYNSEQHNNGQHRERSMRFRVDVWMPRLVNLEHAQHRYHVHERRICQRSDKKLNILLNL